MTLWIWKVRERYERPPRFQTLWLQCCDGGRVQGLCLRETSKNITTPEEFSNVDRHEDYLEGWFNMQITGLHHKS